MIFSWILFYAFESSSSSIWCMSLFLALPLTKITIILTKHMYSCRMLQICAYLIPVQSHHTDELLCHTYAYIYVFVFGLIYTQMFAFRIWHGSLLLVLTNTPQTNEPDNDTHYLQFRFRDWEKLTGMVSDGVAVTRCLGGIPIWTFEFIVWDFEHTITT